MDVHPAGLGQRQVQRWNLSDGWVISARPAHPALVSESDFIAVQGIQTLRGATARSDRCYLLAGLLRCGVCGRRTESCWANNRPAYRCRHGHSSSSRSDPDRPKNLYVREDHILPHLPTLHLRLTGLSDAVPDGASPDPGEVIGDLRTRKLTLTYEPETRTLRTGTPREVKDTIHHRR
ncbi:zinc ribbon domain-containing protein [Actinomadura madurae]|uniref:zinc ribbon domain-containing protein n=1 Tax=Actinomadura madurae TaxID=1993 RepID=UPI00399B18B3